MSIAARDPRARFDRLFGDLFMPGCLTWPGPGAAGRQQDDRCRDGAGLLPGRPGRGDADPARRRRHGAVPVVPAVQRRVDADARVMARGGRTSLPQRAAAASSVVPGDRSVPQNPYPGHPARSQAAEISPVLSRYCPGFLFVRAKGHRLGHCPAECYRLSVFFMSKTAASVAKASGPDAG